jgi:putative endopeptidase
MDKIVDNHLYRIFPLAFAYNNFLTQSYVEVNKNIRTMNYVKTLAEDLITVFKRIIFRNTWLQPETKKKALIKLENIKLEVGYPTNLREDPNIIYSSDDIWDNLIKIANWRVKQAVQLEGKPLIDIAVIDWSKIPPKFISKQAYVVNAFYTPIENSIYIPLGYIQKPFIDLDERGKEYNLSQIGFTISHEMSHSLDDKGSKYDEHGKLYNWWTVKDKKKFKEIQNNIIKQYETFALYDGIKFDASLSIGEDLADISGLNICLEYLRDFQLKNQVILPIQKLSFNMFFVYFAIQQRQLISKKSIDAQLKTNPHPLNKYRCNVPLSRIPIFRILYNITKKDKMWWNSTNRVWEN